MKYFQWVLVLSGILLLFILLTNIYFYIRKKQIPNYINIIIVIFFIINMYGYITELTSFKFKEGTYSIKNCIKKGEKNISENLKRTDYYNSIKNELDKHYFDIIEIKPEYKDINFIDFIKGELTLNNKYVINDNLSVEENSEYLEVAGDVKVKYSNIDFETNTRKLEYIQIGEYKLGMDVDKNILYINPEKKTSLKFVINKNNKDSEVISGYKILDMSPCNEESIFESKEIADIKQKDNNYKNKEDTSIFSDTEE